MTLITDARLIDSLRRLVDTYRERCLWFLKPDFVPASRADAVMALDYIERYGDRAGFIQARHLKTWLLQISSAPSAD
ncbi:MAG: hypothetical protein ABIF71_01520 [Planctomycetota bacterium]